ncbi:uncharacterized protein LOC143194150 [Rhynchophorus ferrugineus]|uniref:uncharacterized protein LOC143194150 n=1 Tax=Rhynchophorus ferrugineus TaxID=354439 RepID=UPI003FCE7C2B
MYVMFSLFFVTIYIAIITLYFSKAKDYYSDDKSVVHQYVKKKWIYYTTLLKVRLQQLRAGQDDQIIKPIKCLRYENCFTIPKNRMNAMALITILLLRNQKPHQTLSREDIGLISNLIREMFGTESEDKDIFFSAEESGRIKFVDNKKIDNISLICEKLAHSSQVDEDTQKPLLKPPIEQRLEKLDTIIEGVKILTRVLNNVNIQFQ